VAIQWTDCLYLRKIISLKRLGSIGLFLLLTLPFAATYTWLQLEKIHIRETVKQQLVAGMDESELIRLEFTPDEAKTRLRWHHEKEFELDGQLYDVVNQSHQNQRIVFWCFADHAETNLDKQMDMLLDSLLNGDQQRRDKKARLLDFNKKLFFENRLAILPINRIQNLGYCLANLQVPTFFYTKPPAPPPRLLS